MVLSQWLALIQRSFRLSRFRNSARAEVRRRRQRAEHTDVPTLVESVETRILLTSTITVAVLDVNASEVAGDTGAFRVTRTGTADALSVDYQIASASTATSGSDYTALSGTVSFAVGEMWKDILVTPLNDSVAESSETVVLNLSTAPEGEYLVGTPATATLRIAADDSGTGLITFAVSGTSLITEDSTDGDSNHANYTIGYTGTLTGSNTASVDVTHVLNQTNAADYTTNVAAAITAAVANTPGTTFNGTTLTFAAAAPTPASSSKYAGTAVNAGYWQSPENAIGNTLGTHATGSITYDYSSEDTGDLRLKNYGFSIPSNATITGVSVVLGTSGYYEGSTGVRLTKNGTSPVGNAVARVGNWSSGSVVYGNASNLWGTTLTPADVNSSSFGVIANFDGNDGNEVYVHLARIDVAYTTPGSAAPTSLNFTAQIADDTIGEPSEAYSVALSNATTTNTPGATITTASVTTTIIDNDVPETPVVTIAAIDATASEAGTSTGTFRITRTDVSGPLTVNYVIDAASTATAGADYTGLSGSVTFAAGEAFRDIVITPINDAIYEPPETVKINLSAATSGQYVLGAQTTATVTIEDDDMVVWVSGTQSGVEGSQNGTLTLTRSGDAVALNVAYQVLSSSLAQSGSDYIAPSGTVSFAVGQLTATIIISVIDDTVIEPSETVNIHILPDMATGTYLVGSPATGTVTIIDNDLATVTISATDPNAGEAGPDTGLFTITRNGSTTSQLTVNFTVSGTATNGTDYAEIPVSAGTGWGSVTIPAGQTSTTLTLTPIADNNVESAETVIVSLLAPSGYSVDSAMGVATVTIADSPPIGDPIVFSITGGQAVTEDSTDGDNNQVTYTIGYTGDLTSGETASVNVAHVLDQTVAADYSTSVAAAINAAVAGTPGVSFNGTTLTFG